MHRIGGIIKGLLVVAFSSEGSILYEHYVSLYSITYYPNQAERGQWKRSLSSVAHPPGATFELCLLHLRNTGPQLRKPAAPI